MGPEVVALFGFTVRQMTRSLKVWLFGLLLFLPWVAALLLQALLAKGVQVPLGGYTLYGMLILGYVLGFLVPLTTLFFGTALIADEVEGGTLPYLFGRPIRREWVFLSRYAALALVLVAGTSVCVAGTYVLCLVGDPGGLLFKEMGTLAGDLATLSLAVLAYGALFGFLGLALKKPLFWGFFIGFGWENLVAWLPGFLKRLTLLFHLHTLLPHASSAEGLVQGLLASSESRAAALGFLLLYTALLLGASCLLIRRLEAGAAEREEG
jgi:ABC-type transport system involved in multi-copper enzyme maturation permease subunit